MKGLSATGSLKAGLDSIIVVAFCGVGDEDREGSYVSWDGLTRRFNFSSDAMTTLAGT